MSLSIGRHIASALGKSSAVTDIVGNRIYPIIMPQGTAYPFVQFETSTASPDYTKDGVAGDNHQIIVNCVAKTYWQSLELAEAVRSALELVTEEYDDYSVDDCRLDGCEEDYINELDAFVSTLTFSAESANINN